MPGPQVVVLRVHVVTLVALLRDVPQGDKGDEGMQGDEGVEGPVGAPVGLFELVVALVHVRFLRVQWAQLDFRGAQVHILRPS